MDTEQAPLPEWDVTIRFGNGRTEQESCQRVAAAERSTAVLIAERRGSRGHMGMRPVALVSAVAVVRRARP